MASGRRSRRDLPPSAATLQPTAARSDAGRAPRAAAVSNPDRRRPPPPGRGRRRRWRPRWPLPPPSALCGAASRRRLAVRGGRHGREPRSPRPDPPRPAARWQGPRQRSAAPPTSGPPRAPRRCPPRRRRPRTSGQRPPSRARSSAPCNRRRRSGEHLLYTGVVRSSRLLSCRGQSGRLRWTRGNGER